MRVDTTADGWGHDVVARLVELPWRLVQVDRSGLRGVFEVDGDAIARLGAITSAVEDLNVVEVRDDIAVVLVRASSAEQRSATASAIGNALAGLGTEPIGIFVDGATMGVAVERWRRDALATALQTMTSVSR